MKANRLIIFLVFALSFFVGCFGRPTNYAKVGEAKRDFWFLFREIEYYKTSNAKYPNRLGDLFPTQTLKMSGNEEHLLKGFSSMPTLNDDSGVIYFYYSEIPSENRIPLLASYRTFFSGARKCHLVLWGDGTMTLESEANFDKMIFDYHMKK